jgi:hypothetical protein
MLVVVVAIEEPITSEVTSMQSKAKQSKREKTKRRRAAKEIL